MGEYKMYNDKISLKLIVDYFVDSHDKNKAHENLQNEIVVKAAKDRIEDIIKKQIMDEMRETVHKEEAAKLEEERQEGILRDTKTLIVQTIILGFVVGLLVNQVTDIFSFYFKGDSLINIGATWIITLICLIVAICLSFYILLKELIPIVKEIQKRKQQ